MKINSKNRGFAKGTMILMADGKLKAIEDIKSGEYVLSFDENDADAPLEPRQVLDTFERIDNNVLEIQVGETYLKVAQDQMFIGPYNDWKQVYNHSHVVDTDGNPVKYTVSQIRTGKHRIYDITVEENHSLVANGIRVHNPAGMTGGSAKANDTAQAKSAADKSKADGAAKKGAETKTNQKGPPSSSPDRGGPGKTKDGRSGGGGTGRDSPSGRAGGGAGGQNNGVGNNNQKVNNGNKGMKKVPKGWPFKKEPDPKPSGSAVAVKLMNTIEQNAYNLHDIIESTNPTQLTTFAGLVVSNTQSTYTFANSFVASIVASEMSAYDKEALIDVGIDIENVVLQIGAMFKGGPITAALQTLALAYVIQLETLVYNGKAILGHYTTADSSGDLTVYVNGQPTTPVAERPGTYYRKQPSGKYAKNTATKPAKRIRGKKQSSAGN